MNSNSNNTSNSQPFRPAGVADESTTSYLVEEYTRWQTLFEAQPPLVQRFFEAQARSLADALLQPASQAQFRLPDRVIASAADSADKPLPPEQREQMVGGFMERLTRTGIGTALRQRLDELEASTNPALSASAGLLRFATATALVRDMLPSGRSVRYQAAQGEDPTRLSTIKAQLRPSRLLRMRLSKRWRSQDGTIRADRPLHSGCQALSLLMGRLR
jgi:hypothetical protein